MKRAITGSQFRKKNVNKVMVKAYNVIWPLFLEEHFDELCRKLKTVERENIVTGCNAVIKLLQSGKAAAFFMIDSLLPKPFAKLLIKMARKRNPSVLAGAVPSFPKQLKSYDRLNMMFAIIDQKPEDQSLATKDTLRWVKETLLRLGYVRANELQRKPVPSKTVKRAKKDPQKPLTKEEIAKLYILEPASGLTKDKKHRVDHFKATDFISFSDKDKSVTIKSKRTGPPSRKPLIDRKAFNKSTNASTKDNKVMLNANEVHLTKKQLTSGASPENQKTNKKSTNTTHEVNKAQGNPNQVQKKKKKQTGAPSDKQLLDGKASKKSTTMAIKVDHAKGNPNQLQQKKKKLKKNLTSK